jgi:threonine/homoserine/homoserine lactone efflux protein
VTLSALSVFAVALIVAAGSPGPSIAAMVARVLTSGLKEVLPFLAAMWIGEAVWLTLAVAGMAAIADRLGQLFVLLRYAGAAYLVYLAIRMWFAPHEIEDRQPSGPQRPWKMFGAGLAVTLGNPKIMVFYLALLPTIVDIAHVGMAGWVELSATMLLVLIAVDLAWALLAARARRLLASRRAVRIANRTGAVVMAGAAATIAAN